MNWSPIERNPTGGFFLEGAPLLEGDVFVTCSRGGQKVELKWHHDTHGRAMATFELAVARAEGEAGDPLTKKLLLVLFERTLAHRGKKG